MKVHPQHVIQLENERNSNQVHQANIQSADQMANLQPPDISIDETRIESFDTDPLNQSQIDNVPEFAQMAPEENIEFKNDVPVNTFEENIDNSISNGQDFRQNQDDDMNIDSIMDEELRNGALDSVEMQNEESINNVQDFEGNQVDTVYAIDENSENSEQREANNSFFG